MSRGTVLVLSSLAAHAALGLFIGEIEVKKSHAATAIEYAESHKKKPEPAKVDPDPAPPKTERVRPVAHRAPAAPPPPQAPQPNKPAPSAPVDDLPDFGLSLSGSANGTGIALPAAGAARPSPLDKLVVKKKAVALATPAERSVECDEPASKPRPISVPQPPYSEQARSAQIQGKVRVQITVDENGNVVDVKIIRGLGYGLDEAALAAARAARFEPALQCGKPVRATFNIGMRFSL